jgi:hypothetical protein
MVQSLCPSVVLRTMYLAPLAFEETVLVTNWNWAFPQVGALKLTKSPPADGVGWSEPVQGLSRALGPEEAFLVSYFVKQIEMGDGLFFCFAQGEGGASILKEDVNGSESLGALISISFNGQSSCCRNQLPATGQFLQSLLTTDFASVTLSNWEVASHRGTLAWALQWSNPFLKTQVVHSVRPPSGAFIVCRLSWRSCAERRPG